MRENIKFLFRMDMAKLLLTVWVCPFGVFTVSVPADKELNVFVGIYDLTQNRQELVLYCKHIGQLPVTEK